MVSPCMFVSIVVTLLGVRSSSFVSCLSGLGVKLSTVITNFSVTYCVNSSSVGFAWTRQELEECFFLSANSSLLMSQLTGICFCIIIDLIKVFAMNKIIVRKSNKGSKGVAI